jgi:hypothetical protein
MARSERFELPTLGIEIRCSIQLSYERLYRTGYQIWRATASVQRDRAPRKSAALSRAILPQERAVTEGEMNAP